MPSEPHTVVDHAGKVWVCTACTRVWTVEDTPICTICNSVAIECKYCEAWKPDYECYNVSFVGSDDDGKEVIAEAEEMCDTCLKTLCFEHNIELDLNVLNTVADDIKNGDWDYDPSCKKTDEEDIL